jgi:hypothetical protein
MTIQVSFWAKVGVFASPWISVANRARTASASLRADSSSKARSRFVAIISRITALSARQLEHLAMWAVEKAICVRLTFCRISRFLMMVRALLHNGCLGVIVFPSEATP